MSIQAASVQHKIPLVCTVLLTLAACQQSKDNTAAAQRGSTELDWARSALERNPNLEILATDAQAGVFTLRVRSTGEMKAVQLSELAATPLSQLTSPTPAAATAPAQPEPAQAVPATTTPATAREPSMMAAQPSEPDRSVPRDLSKPISEQPGFTVERTQGQVKISGPGVSIVSSGTGGEAGRTGAASQQTIEPIICEGRRMLHFDNRSIYVEGDAITVRGGCEIYITNSRVISSGTGLIIRDGATAHIINSHIEGSAASFQADGGSKVYVRSSTFQGLSRRDMLATVQDEGGNQWR